MSTNDPEYLVIHHSATADSGTVSWDEIREYHVNTLGWSDIGYHFGIELVEDGAEIFVGRSPLWVGAHAKELGMNSRSLGICVVGNYDIIVPNAKVLNRLDMLIGWLVTIYPIKDVIGHRDVGLMAGYDWGRGQYKTCPGKLFPLERYKL